MAVRVTVVAVLLALACGCVTAGPVLSDAERCARFGGGWSNGTCRTGAP